MTGKPTWTTYPFYAIALDTIPRILGFCDRNTDSPTYGCCDRNYWKYKILDFPNARFQESGLLFALAYTSELPDNLFFQNQKMAAWSKQVWRFWLAQRNRDGSANELYPNEHSFCATAFTTGAFLETVILLGGIEKWEEEVQASRSSVKWLSNHDNTRVANQMAASLWALTAYAHLSGEQRDWDNADERKLQIVALATTDGILPEYGGLDLGYQSISLSALERVRALGLDDSSLNKLIARAADLVEQLTISGRNTASFRNSRNTQYVFPYALSLCERPILTHLLTGLANRELLNPSWMDDRYCISMAIDYWMAGMELCDVDDHH